MGIILNTVIIIYCHRLELLRNNLLMIIFSSFDGFQSYSCTILLVLIFCACRKPKLHSNKHIAMFQYDYKINDKHMWHCLQSRLFDVLDIINIEALNIAMDRNEFQSATYQRVYQYLCRHEKGNIDRFHYSGKVEGSDINCLEVISR